MEDLMPEIDPAVVDRVFASEWNKAESLEALAKLMGITAAEAELQANDMRERGIYLVPLIGETDGGHLRSHEDNQGHDP